MATQVRPRPPVFRALGKAEPPLKVEVDGQTFERCEIFKHDSWAATARYSGPQFDIVCKFNRIQPIFCLPTRWLGRFLARREQNAYLRLESIDGLPAACGPIYLDSKVLSNAVAHHFVAGRTLKSGESVGEQFFPKLKQTLDEIHKAGFAYVDLHKRENILVGADGEPYLIDFQISYQSRQLFRKLPPARWLLRLFQLSDEFCLSKHVRNHRPEQLAALGLERFSRPPWWIRAHRLIAVPFRQTRRKFLRWIRVRDHRGSAASELFAEHAFRD